MLRHKCCAPHSFLHILPEPRSFQGSAHTAAPTAGDCAISHYIKKGGGLLLRPWIPNKVVYTQGMYEGAAAPSYTIRSSDMCDRGTEACFRLRRIKSRRSVGNRKERLRNYASSPEGCKPLPISFSGRTRSVQENDVLSAERMRQQPYSERPATILCCRS